MIVSHSRNFIFVHIPKSGGTSLNAALEPHLAPADLVIADTARGQQSRAALADVQTAGRLWKHSTLADAEGLISRDDMARMLIVTLVRNPWDRLVSYYHWLRAQTFGHPDVARAKATTFSGFLNDPATQRTLRADPYARYATDGAGHAHAALFARIEHWRKDLAPFFEHVGVTLELPYTNRSDRPTDWRAEYTDADAALVGRLCAVDIARSGYAFDPD